MRLWFALRTRPGGFKFRRHYPVAEYALDFACLRARLAIEIDGEVHGRGHNLGRDRARDKALAALGVATIRFAARDVVADLDAVIAAIVAACRERAPLHHDAARRGPPPRAGEVR
ncbi:endonuclease domain-containing protein [Sphingomonas citri]